jgi:hypothetical protein
MLTEGSTRDSVGKALSASASAGVERDRDVLQDRSLVFLT